MTEKYRKLIWIMHPDMFFAIPHGIITPREFDRANGRSAAALARQNSEKYSHLRFDPRKPTGPLMNECDEIGYNLGVDGMFFVLAANDGQWVSDTYVRRLFEQSGDDYDFWQWLPALAKEVNNLHNWAQ